MFGRRLVPQGPGKFVAAGGEAVHIPLPTGEPDARRHPPSSPRQLVPLLASPSGAGRPRVCRPHRLPATAAGSCLVLKGNGADLSMHCVPPVSARRMSVTLRRMGPEHGAAVRRAAAAAAERGGGAFWDNEGREGAERPRGVVIK
jgi:hypothetical protein